MRRYWFGALMATICLEGLGRKYIPQISSTAFYFLKDVVLLSGLFVFKPSAAIRRTWRELYRGFGLVWVIALGWTVIETMNPEQTSFALAFIGLRAYWLWWLAPVLVASAIERAREHTRAIYVLVGLTFVIALLAAVQFVSPTDSALNLYSVVDGKAVYAADAGIVYSTGRARVSSTFSFLSGFQDFVLLIPTLLLSLGLEATDKKVRTSALLAALAAASVIPMSGSRAGVILGGAVLFLTCWAAGLFFTVAGRRMMIGATAAIILASVAFPDALFGVQSRFNSEETQDRIMESASVLPPVALAMFEYPAMGIGTGMQQNARYSLQVDAGWNSEMESQRYLVELGAIGFCFVWVAKFGLIVGLIRAYRILKRANRRAGSGAALYFAAVTLFGNLTFDHIWQALYFVGCGFILAETVAALNQSSTALGPDGVLTKAASEPVRRLA